MRMYTSIPATILLSSLAASMAAFASSDINKETVVGQRIEQKDILEYWTAERLKNAKALPMPTADINNVKKMPLSHVNTGISESGDGALPEVNLNVNAQHLFNLNDGAGDDVVGGEVNGRDIPVPNDSGTYGQPFTSSRLVPITADISYPYRTVGKLFFTIPGSGDYVCSASVLRPRVVVTAGHCTHKGSGGASGFYNNFYFVPAYRDGAAPYQTWTPSYVQTTSAWATGGGGVPNEADYSMFQMVDKNINGTVTKIGSVTGYLGYQTVALASNHATILGYACNLDSCAKMHQVGARNGATVSPNNVEYGSDMRGGSSGGPWIQNFGALAVGQTGGTNPGSNRIIGITSYGYDSTDPKVQGSSIPDNRFLSLLTSTCNLSVGNC